MKRGLSRTFHRLGGTTIKLMLVMAGFLVLWGMLSPITTIVWWLNQTASSLGFKSEKEEPAVLQSTAESSAASDVDCYIIFLPGVGNFSPNAITDGEQYFIEQLASRHDSCVVVKDVFPYSVANQDLGSQNILLPLWEAAEESEGFSRLFIQVRNLWRFAISTDDRYGPVYNLGIARTIVDRMHATYPIPQSGRPINLILMSTSGGTQVAFGATDHLRDWIDDVRITVVSVGGAFDGKEGFNEADHVYHLYSDQDWVTELPRFVFPARWPSWQGVVGSPIHQAERRGAYTPYVIGSMKHDGEEGYFGEAIASGNTAYVDETYVDETYVDETLEQAAQLPIWSTDQPLADVCPTSE